MSDWVHIQADIDEQLMQLHYFSIVKPQASGNVTFAITVKEFAVPPPGQRLRFYAEADKAVIERLGEVAAARGVSRAQIALAWMMQKPAIVGPIVGATKPHHLEDAAAAVALKLTPEEMKALEELYVAHPVLGLS